MNKRNTASHSLHVSFSFPVFQDRERVNNIRTEFPSSTSFLLGTTEGLQNPWLSILRYMTLFLAVIPVSLPFVLDCAYCVQAWLIQGDAAMTVVAPQQPLGSSFAFGIGTTPAGTRGQEQSCPASGIATEAGNNASNLMTSSDSLGPDISIENRRSKLLSGEAIGGATRSCSNEDDNAAGDAFDLPADSSQTMRSYAQAKGDTTWPSVHTPSIIPDLGQVDFIFIDKTGTLTGNDMTFSMCSIVGRYVVVWESLPIASSIPPLQYRLAAIALGLP